MLTTPEAIAKKLLEVLSKIPPDLQDACEDIATEFFKDYQREAVKACADLLLELVPIYEKYQEVTPGEALKEVASEILKLIPKKE